MFLYPPTPGILFFNSWSLKPERSRLATFIDSIFPFHLFFIFPTVNLFVPSGHPLRHPTNKAFVIIYTPVFSIIYSHVFSITYTPLFSIIYNPLFSIIYTPVFSIMYTPVFSIIYTPLFRFILVQFDDTHKVVYELFCIYCERFSKVTTNIKCNILGGKGSCIKSYFF